MCHKRKKEAKKKDDVGHVGQERWGLQEDDSQGPARTEQVRLLQKRISQENGIIRTKADLNFLRRDADSEARSEIKLNYVNPMKDCKGKKAKAQKSELLHGSAVTSASECKH